MKNLSKMKTLEVHAPEAIKAFVAFDKAALAERAIPGKYKELMALAPSFATLLEWASMRGSHALRDSSPPSLPCAMPRHLRDRSISKARYCSEENPRSCDPSTYRHGCDPPDSAESVVESRPSALPGNRRSCQYIVPNCSPHITAAAWCRSYPIAGETPRKTRRRCVNGSSICADEACAPPATERLTSISDLETGRGTAATPLGFEDRPRRQRRNHHETQRCIACDCGVSYLAGHWIGHRRRRRRRFQRLPERQVSAQPKQELY
jgi:hypothetical protein